MSIIPLQGLPWQLSGRESSCNAGDLQEMQVRSLGQEDPLEKEMATLQYPCLENPMNRSPAGCDPWVTKESDTT